MTNTKTQGVCGAVENEVSSDTTAQEALEEALYKVFSKRNAGELFAYCLAILEGKQPMPSAFIYPQTDVEALKRERVDPVLYGIASCKFNQGWNAAIDEVNQRGLIATGWNTDMAAAPYSKNVLVSINGKVTYAARYKGKKTGWWGYDGTPLTGEPDGWMEKPTALPPKTDKQGQSDE